MATAQVAKCTSCGADASMRCAGCIDAPDYLPGDSLNVVYCGQGCQKENWPIHKVLCRDMKRRKKLLRAAHVLKAAVLTYRDVVYDIDLTKIESRDGILYLHQNQQSILSRRKYGPFPSQITTNVHHKEAALVMNQCTMAMALLSRLTRKLLSGIASSIEVMDIHIEKPLMPAKLIPGPDWSECPHTVIKVHPAFTTESWVIDTTGCQYGFQDVLIPFDKYIADKACRVIDEPTTYVASETKDLDYFSTLPFMNKTKAQSWNIRMERKARLHFAEFVGNGVCKEILDGSNADFSRQLESFVNELKSHMLSLEIK